MTTPYSALNLLGRAFGLWRRRFSSIQKFAWSVALAMATTSQLKFIGVIYAGTKGTGTLHFLD